MKSLRVSPRATLLGFTVFLLVSAAFLMAIFMVACLSSNACTGPFFSVNGCFTFFSGGTETCSVVVFWLTATVFFFIGVGFGVGLLLWEVTFAPVYTAQMTVRKTYGCHSCLVYLIFIVGTAMLGLYFTLFFQGMANIVFTITSSAGFLLAISGGMAPVFLYDVGFHSQNQPNGTYKDDPQGRKEAAQSAGGGSAPLGGQGGGRGVLGGRVSED